MAYKPEGFHNATPYLMVNDLPKALEFYEKAFGAVVLSSHPEFKNVEIKIGDSPMMVSEHVINADGKQSLDDLPRMSIYLYVEDADAVAKQAIAAGAKELYLPQDQPYGIREGGVADPFGIIWWIATLIEKSTSKVNI
jgi:PhnB protein